MISNNAIDNTLATENTKPVGIRMSENCTSIVQALISFSAEVKPIEKNGKNNFQNYKYARLEDIIDGVKKLFLKNNLFCFTTVNTTVYLPPKQTKNGITQCVMVGITTRLIHNSGEWIEVDCYGEGQDVGDKAIYKAITGARKYALTCLLNLSTTDDPENDSDEKNEKQNFKTSEIRRSPQQNNDNQQSKQNGYAKPNGANGQLLRPPLQSTAKHQLLKDDADIRLDEILNSMKGAKSAKELIDSYELGKSELWCIMTPEQKAEMLRVKSELWYAMTPEQQAEIVKVKDEMKGNIIAA